MPIIYGSGGIPRQLAGAPVAGTDEIQTITITGTGSYKLSYEGQNTAAIAHDATAAAVDAALELLQTIGAGGVVVTGSAGGPYTVTFAGNLGKRDVSTIGSNSLVGVTSVTIVKATPGVEASGRGADTGAQLVDTTTGILYSNTGTRMAPVWTKVGLQT